MNQWNSTDAAGLGAGACGIMLKDIDWSCYGLIR